MLCAIITRASGKTKVLSAGACGSKREVGNSEALEPLGVLDLISRTSPTVRQNEAAALGTF